MALEFAKELLGDAYTGELEEKLEAKINELYAPKADLDAASARADGLQEQLDAANEAIGKFLTFFYDPENYVGWVSMEDFLPAVNSAVAALVEANPSFEAWLKVLDGCKFYPTAKTEWIDVKQGAAAVEQSALTGGDVKTLLDELQAKVTK